MSTEDGPGLRTTVFFKGCPLKCKWCHNPESIPYKFDKEWIKTSCIFCLDCIKACKYDAIHYENGEIILDRDKCTLCMKCVEDCPTNALKKIGEDIDAIDLYNEIIKDKAYYTNGGGITLSGGEVLVQAKEIKELMKLLKQDGIRIAVDTSGLVSFDQIETILDYADMFLYDIKLYDRESHIDFCGVDNQLILENLKKLNQANKRLWIRTPIIPDSTDSEENIKSIADFLLGNHIDFERWELCAFNNLCKDKYSRLNIDWVYKDSLLIEKDKMHALETIARNVLKNKKESIFATGNTRLEVRK